MPSLRSKSRPRKRTAKLLTSAPGARRADASPEIPARLQKFLSIADQTLGPEVRQRSVIDVQPVFQPPKPPVRPAQPPRPPLTLPKPPMGRRAPKPVSSLPKRGRS